MTDKTRHARAQKELCPEKRRLTVAFGLILLLNSACGVQAQLPQIRLSSVFPSGGQRGTSFDVTVVGGTDLDEASELIFSHPGITAIARSDSAGDPIANQFHVSVDSATQPGVYDVRVRGLFGISNPRLFRIDTLPEVVDREPNNKSEQAQDVPLNTVVNARSHAAADVDTFRIQASAGQTIVFRSEAASLDSLMQPVMELFDESGRRVARSRRQLHRDATVVFTSPSQQTLELTVHDVVYGGGSDYGYRLAVDTRPQVDFTIPAVIPADQDSRVTLYGRHLPEGKPTGFSFDGQPLLSRETNVRLPLSSLGVIGTGSAAASLDSRIYSVPTVISGGLQQKMDVDIFRFEAKKGQRWQLEVLADRLGSIADPVLLVEQVTVDGDGRESTRRLAREELGRQNPGGNQLPTLTRDPAFLLAVAQDGTYQVRIQDRYSASRGSVHMSYSILIHTPKPDFQPLIFDSVPSADGKAAASTGAISLRKGGTYELPIYVYRSGGHNDEVVIQAKGLPPGMTLSRTRITPGRNSGLAVFTAAPDAAEAIARIELIALSTTGGKTITRNVRATTLVHGGANGLPRTGRVAGALMAAIMKDEQPVHVTSGVTDVDVSQDQQLLVPLTLTRSASFANKVDLTFSGVPKNVDLPKISFAKDKTASVARFFFKENVAPGTFFLQIHATAQVPYRRNPWSVDRAKVRVAEATEQLKASQKAVTDAQAIVEKGPELISKLATQQADVQKQLEMATQESAVVSKELKSAVGSREEAFRKLRSLQAELRESDQAVGDDLSASIQEVQKAATAVEEATKPIVSLARKLQTLQAKVARQMQSVKSKTQEIDSIRQQMEARKEAVKTAEIQKTQAEAAVMAAEAERKAAEERVKKAEAASKAQNRNLRTAIVPVRITVHPTPGKLAAAVPAGGAIKKGTSIDVGVTLNRKNKFEGSVSIELVVPEGVTGIQSTAVEIPAGESKATLKISAAPKATVTAVANAVIRATTDFNGRASVFDVPVALKITD